MYSCLSLIHISLNMPEDMLREGLKAVGDAVASIAQEKLETAGARAI